MKRIIPVLLSTLLLTGCHASCGRRDNGYRQISATEAASIMNRETSYIILDVRTAKEYSEGHIPGAINVPNEIINDKAIPALLDKDQMILVYCRSGRRSKLAAEKLVLLGYTNVIEFGGILDWQGEIVK